MSEQKEWELKTAQDVANALEWLRKRTKGRALVLIAIGVNSVAYTKDPKLSPHDAAQLLKDSLPAVHQGFEKLKGKR